MTTQNLAVIGECMIELSQKGADVHRGFGGDTLNTSVYIARQVDAQTLGVHYVTALGQDGPSPRMRGTLEAVQGPAGRRRSIPAHAGNTLAATNCPQRTI